MHDQRCGQIRWLLEEIKVGVMRAEDMRDQAREVRPSVAPSEDCQQPLADFLDAAIN
ncbi:hypothetical protein COLO4_08152 [Corchorus olitorius]|uniref:Uncharacterized protein n=1 Tax=Corchorus olitorius TaxID=93759 RepID=A0A1R3KH39_9ROSI|nr:hypothetical protein COLO4_08152 [Corchorus olitorius]